MKIICGLNRNLKVTCMGLAVVLSMKANQAVAEATFMTGPKWFECNAQQICFSMSGLDAATSYFAPERFYFRQVNFKLFSRKNRKVAQKNLFAKMAFSADKAKTWYLQGATDGRDYTFDTITMKLQVIAK